MKTILFLVFGLVLLFGCLGGDNQGQDNLYSYKDVTVAKDDIPETCEGLEDCAMFECMVDQCWCKPNILETDYLYKKDTTISSEEEAKALVKSFLDEKGFPYDSITNAVKLNGIFYNVFYEVDGSELVLTVSADGAIFETVCGV